MIRQDLHLHTTFSDGLDTPEEMAHAAIQCGLQRICFTDHVRADSAWWPEYYQTCLSLKRALSGQLIIDCGVEAKICDFRGNLDVPADLNRDVLQVAAIHRLPCGDGTYWKRSELKEHGHTAVMYWKQALIGLSGNEHVSRLAHPFSLLPDMDVQMDDLFWEEVTDIMERGTYLIEYNRKYRNDFIPKEFWNHFKQRIVIGSDSHSKETLYEMWKNDKAGE